MNFKTNTEVRPSMVVRMLKVVTWTMFLISLLPIISAPLLVAGVAGLGVAGAVIIGMFLMITTSSTGIMSAAALAFAVMCFFAVHKKSSKFVYATLAVIEIFILTYYFAILDSGILTR